MNLFWRSNRLIAKAMKVLTLTQRIASGYLVMILFFLTISILTYLINANTISMLTHFSRYSNKALDASSFSVDINRLKQASDNYIHGGFNSAAQEVYRIHDELLKKLAEEKHNNLTYETVLVIREHLNRYIKAFKKAQKQKKLQSSLIHVEIPRIMSQINVMIDLKKRRESHNTPLSHLELRNLLLTIENNMHRYFNTYDTRYRNNIQTKLRQLHTLFSKEKDKRKLYEALNSFDHAITASLLRTRGYLYLINVVMSAEAYEMIYQADRIADILKNRMLQTEEHIISNIEAHKLFITVSTVLFLLFLLAVAYVMGASITQPIKALTKTFKEMVQGSQKEVDIVYTQKDEIYDLVRAAESFRLKNIENKSLLSQYKTLNETLEEQVEKRTQEIKEKNRILKKLAVTDNLTSLYNRNKLNEVIRDEVARSKRYGSSFSVILFDIDHFKQVNDTYGHQTGDTVLKQIAHLLTKLCRQCDTIGRWGGEEFMILCPNTDKTEAATLAEKLRGTIARFHFEKSGQITSSFGVCTADTDLTEEELVAKADKALYHAKNSGRNKVSVCT